VPSLTSKMILSIASCAVDTALLSSSTSQLFASHNSEKVTTASIVALVPEIIRRIINFVDEIVLRRASGANTASILRRISPSEILSSMVSSNVFSIEDKISFRSVGAVVASRSRRTS